MAATFAPCSSRHASRRGLLEPNDNQPGGPSSRTITIHLTRDTLLLIAALAFLAVAILLAVIFPSASSSNPNLSNTGEAQSSVSPQGRATTVSIGAAGTPALVPTTSIQPSGVDSQANYPGPNAEAAQVASSATAAATGVPVFDPRRTAEAAGGLLAQGSTAYPGPTTATSTSPAVRSPTANPGATPTRTPALFQPATTVTVSPEVSPTARPTVAQATVAQP